MRARLALILLVTGLVATACGDGSGGTSPAGTPRAPAIVHVEERQLLGDAVPIEGDVTFLEVQPDAFLEWQPDLHVHDAREKLELVAGRHVVVVHNFVCSTRCPGWTQIEKTIQLQRARNSGQSYMGRALASCAIQVVLEQRESLTITPRMLEPEDAQARCELRASGASRDAVIAASSVVLSAEEAIKMKQANDSVAVSGYVMYEASGLVRFCSSVPKGSALHDIAPLCTAEPGLRVEGLDPRDYGVEPGGHSTYPITLFGSLTRGSFHVGT